LGASFRDFFGVDKIVWVEGPTEAQCFREIYEFCLAEFTAIINFVPFRDVSAFDKKTRDPEELFDIYEGALRTSIMLPPKVSYSFDSEERTVEQKQDLDRKSKGRAKFLPKRMYENYLLHPKAVAAILTEIDEQRDYSDTDVDGKLQELVAQIESCGEQGNYDGAQILKQLFSDLTEHRYTYRKVEHGLALTRWLLENDRQHIEGLIDYVRDLTLISEQHGSN
jgi:hypothetical protein